MKVEFFGVVIFCIFCVMLNGTVVYGASENQPCSVLINNVNNLLPVTLGAT